MLSRLRPVPVFSNSCNSCIRNGIEVNGLQWIIRALYQAVVRITFRIVLGAPAQQLQNCRRQIQPLVGQGVNDPACIIRIALSQNDIALFQFLQAVGKYIGGNFLRRLQEILKILLSHKEDVPDDKQGPLVAQYIERATDGAGGALGLIWFTHFTSAYYFGCIVQLIDYTCIMQR
jgi:hypothetical protein